MSILSEVQRIQNAKQKLRKALIRKGINIPSTDLLNEYNVDVDPITKGENLTYLTKELNYLTFKWVKDGQFYWSVNYANSSNPDTTVNSTIEYCKNGGSWISVTSDPDGFICDTIAGDEIWVRGNNSTYSNAETNYCHFIIYGKCYISGNISSLLNWASELTEDWCFNGLFIGSHVDIDMDKGLLLPFTTLTIRCYNQMFKNCKLLTNAPYLPATILPAYCYCDMFWGCSSLTMVQEILQGTISNHCYSSMFRECTSLIKAPYLPCEIQNNVDYSSCYIYMFADCTNLCEVQDTLSITTAKEAIYKCMFQNCINLRTAPAVLITSTVKACCQQMFDGCVNINNIKFMITKHNNFDNSYNHTTNFVRNVAHNGVFIKSSQMGFGESITSTSLAYSLHGIPPGWIVEDMPISEFKIEAVSNITISFSNNFYYNFGRGWNLCTPSNSINVESDNEVFIKTTNTPTTQSGIGTFSITGTFNISGNVLSLLNYGNLNDNDYAFKNLFMGCTGLIDASDLVLPNDISEGCYLGMFKNCTGLIDVPTLPATTLAQSCYESMFYGCTSLVNAPILSATTLVQDCYKQMFYNCSSLQLITSMNETALGATYSNNWVYGVNATGSFVRNYYTNWPNQFGDSLIPIGWEIPIDYSTLYFTIESLEDNNTIKWVKSGGPSVSLSYSTDNGQNWTDVTLSANRDFATINTGDSIIFKGINNKISSAWNQYNRFNATKTFKTYGNAMSILWGDDFINHSEFKSGTTHSLCGLFYGTTTLTDASNLILPALTCVASCYNGMFRGCTNLVNSPQLPATQSALDCYSSMFEGCINLEDVYVPEINLVNNSTTCCKNMFCMDRDSMVTTPKMTKSPILRASTGATNCYQQMFCGNGNLTEVTCLLEDGVGCADWLKYGSSTGTFKKASGITWASGTSGIPSGWTIEDYVDPEEEEEESE